MNKSLITYVHSSLLRKKIWSLTNPSGLCSNPDKKAKILTEAIMHIKHIKHKTSEIW